MTVLEAVQYEARRSPTMADRYLALLAAVLLGYAVMGKGFAYIGLPPLYIGEISFLLGILAFLRSGACVASLATLPSLLLAALMALVVVRTIPFLGAYGFDALRDSVIVLYGGFCFMVIALLLEDARRIDTLLRYYNILVTALPAMSVGYLATRYLWDYLPRYGPNIPILDVQTSAVGMHLAGTAVFVLIGYRRVSPLWLAIWLTTFAIAGAENRGALLAAVVPLGFAMLMLGRLRLLLSLAVSAVVLFAVAYGLEATFSHYHEAEESTERPVSAHQLVENVKSIFGQGGEQAQGTKEWRLEWWQAIIDKTFNGPYFWTGRGFGLDLAAADGFETPPDPADPHPIPMSRSPHSAHMNILARTGVPGLALWVLLLVSWGVMMVKAMLAARSRGDRDWAELFLFIVCYVMAVMINASVDVVIEGPMQGIWFWCLFGFGIGSVMVYRTRAASAEAEAGEG